MAGFVRYHNFGGFLIKWVTPYLLFRYLFFKILTSICTQRQL